MLLTTIFFIWKSDSVIAENYMCYSVKIKSQSNTLLGSLCRKKKSKSYKHKSLEMSLIQQMVYSLGNKRV